MDRKDEIIQLQNEIMQGLLRQRMQLVSEDLWGIRPDSPQAQPIKAPDAPRPAAETPPPQAPRPAAQVQEEKQPQPEEAPPEKMEDLLETDSEGRFTLKAGQTACFEGFVPESPPD